VRGLIYTESASRGLQKSQALKIAPGELCAFGHRKEMENKLLSCNKNNNNDTKLCGIKLPKVLAGPTFYQIVFHVTTSVITFAAFMVLWVRFACSLLFSFISKL